MRNTVLLADGAVNRRGALRDILEKHFNVVEADSLRQARLLLDQNLYGIAAVLPEMELLSQENGSFLTDPKQKKLLDDIPVIVITRSDSPESDGIAFDWGADYTIHQPFHPTLVEKTVQNIVALYSHKWNLEKIVREQQDALTHSNDIMVDTLSTIIECRSVESGQHVLRIRHFTRILLEEIAAACPEYNLDESTIRSISSASALHDIGKISIPDAILNKPGRLTDEEREIMKTHSVAGSAILERMGGMGNEEYLRYAYNICHYHHERWDGSGYPDGLAGDAIPICAQVVGLVDVFDALTTKRVYKDAYSCRDAITMILNGECGQFSPKLLECFKHVQNEMCRLAEYYADGTPVTSDRITEPLAPPGHTSANSLQSVLAKYEALLHYLNATVIEIDHDNNIIHNIYNPNPDLHSLQNTGNLMQVISNVGIQLVHPDDRAMLTEQYNDYLEMFFSSGLHRSARRYRIRHADGVYHYYNVTTFRLSSEERKALVIFEPAEDAPASEIQYPAARQRSLFEIPQCCRYDRWLTMEEVTDEFAGLLGYTADELSVSCQCRMIDCILPESRKRLYQQISDQLAHSGSVIVEIPLIKKDGSILWVLAKGILRTGQNGIEYLYGTMTDITPAKNPGNSSIVPQELLASLYEQSDDVVYIWDRVRDELIFSDNWYVKFGRDPISDNASDRIFNSSFIHPDDLPSLKNALSATRAGKNFAEVSMRVIDASGHYNWYLFRFAPICDENGNVLRHIGSITAISDDW